MLSLSDFPWNLNMVDFRTDHHNYLNKTVECAGLTFNRLKILDLIFPSLINLLSCKTIAFLSAIASLPELLVTVLKW